MADSQLSDAISDYVVVGAGSAGCVLANRLSADLSSTVTLIEAGGDDRPLHNRQQLWTNFMIHVPAGFNFAIKDRNANWAFATEEDPSSGGRVHEWPRGKVFGGSSSINGMIYTRGTGYDYDRWEHAGAKGWNWRDVLPYFKKSENSEAGADDWHGVGGPLNVASADVRLPLLDAVMKACDSVGMPTMADAHGEVPSASYLRFTTRNGRRCSAAVAFLHPAMNRSSLKILSGALVSRVVIENRRAVGVEIIREGKSEIVRARREVVLAAGAVASPMILERSGIGQADRLASLGIQVVAESPNVGENMQDHYLIPMLYRIRKGTVTLNDMARGWRFGREVMRYMVLRRGLLTSPAVHAFAFAKSRPDIAVPDLNFALMPATPAAPATDGLPVHAFLEKEPGLTIGPMPLRPESRGSIHATSADPHANPRIQANYLSDPDDQAVAIAGLKIGRSIAEAPALAPYVEAELVPGKGVTSDADLLDYARHMGVTAYHPTSTCAMGGDNSSVVDPTLRVRGIEGLRIVDASIMPYLISGNTNAPTIMIAEKAADMILGDARKALAA